MDIKLLKGRMRSDSGFTLMEIVVAVGILLVLTGGGLSASGAIIKTARQAAVNSAASEVLTGAMAYEIDTTPKVAKDAETEWNGTSKKNKDGTAHITTEVRNSATCIAVKASNLHDQESVRSRGISCPDDIKTGDYFGENPSKTLPDTLTPPGGNGNENTNPGGNNGTPGDENGNGIPEYEENSEAPDPSGENEGFALPDDLTNVVENPTETNTKASVSATNSKNKALYGVRVSHLYDADAKYENGGSIDYKYEDFNEHMAIGTDIYISEWLTQVEGFYVSPSLTSKGASNGLARYTANSNRAADDLWISVKGELKMASGEPGSSIATRTVLPKNVVWIDFENVPGKFYTSAGREVWDFTTDVNWAGGYQDEFSGNMERLITLAETKETTVKSAGAKNSVRVSSETVVKKADPSYRGVKISIQESMNTSYTGLPVGTQFKVSKWVADLPGFNVSPNLSYVGTQGKFEVWVNTARNPGTAAWQTPQYREWIKVESEVVGLNDGIASIELELPANKKWEFWNMDRIYTNSAGNGVYRLNHLQKWAW